MLKIKTALITLSCTLFMVSACAGGQKKSQSLEIDKTTDIAGNANKIAFSYYAKKAAGKNENFFFSPYSLRSAFAMVREGANGKTASEINTVFAYPNKNKDLRLEESRLAKEIAEASDGALFKQANAVWAQKKFHFLPAYLSALKTYYGAIAKEADFADNLEEAIANINSWTSDNTSGKIPELFEKGVLTNMTRMVLVNAVYFKGSWDRAFNKDFTFESDFHIYSSSAVQVNFMRHEEALNFPYTQINNVQYLALPYKSKGLEMLIALPKDEEAMSRLEQSLSFDKIEEIRAMMYTAKVKVFFPKFTFSSKHNLNEALIDLGMPLSFTTNADFSGMTGKKVLYIQHAVQKAFIDVNEEGTEAAAASGVSMMLRSVAAPSTVFFRADRPFVFFIRDKSSGFVLFLGKLVSPHII